MLGSSRSGPTRMARGHRTRGALPRTRVQGGDSSSSPGHLSRFEESTAATEHTWLDLLGLPWLLMVPGRDSSSSPGHLNGLEDSFCCS